MRTRESRVYGGSSKPVTFQGAGGASVTPSDTTVFSPGVLYIGTGGTLVVKTIDGTQLTFSNVPDGTFFPMVCIMVYSTGTTCSDILVLY